MAQKRFLFYMDVLEKYLSSLVYTLHRRRRRRNDNEQMFMVDIFLISLWHQFLHLFICHLASTRSSKRTVRCAETALVASTQRNLIFHSKVHINIIIFRASVAHYWCHVVHSLLAVKWFLTAVWRRDCLYQFLHTHRLERTQCSIQYRYR